MLLFRSEGHVRRWCDAWKMEPGAVLSLEQAWRLAAAWFADDRAAPGWARPPVEQIEALFRSLGLVEPFWNLRPSSIHP